MDEKIDNSRAWSGVARFDQGKLANVVGWRGK